jgi:CBS-domain-containing membrane protein
MTDRKDKPGGDFVPVLTDEDVLDAMNRLPGYLDITTEDFRALYLLAFEHALTRLVGGLRAGDLMRSAETRISPELTLRVAVETMAAQQLKSAPVTNSEKMVLGVLSETDVLRRLGVGTFLELITQPPARRADLDTCLDGTAVRDVMTAPAVTVDLDADFEIILRAFQSHAGRRMPVVDSRGRLQGILARKDFLAVCPRGFR